MARHGSDRLAEWLRQSRLKAYELARLLRIKPATLSKIMVGHRLPTLAIALRIADTTGIPVNSWRERRRGIVGNGKRGGSKSTSISQVEIDAVQT
jgi:transcriptional regulator with XRE-family HTH domain